MLSAAAADRRHSLRQHHLRRRVDLHSPARQRHRVRLAPPLRAGDRRRDAVPFGLRERPVSARRTAGMTHDLVFLLDVDNTLLNNDAVTEDLRRHLIDAFGIEAQQRYWEIFEEMRHELGYADYLGALQRYRVEHPRETRLLG